MTEPRWLSKQEAAVWRPIAAMLTLVPHLIEEGVQRHGLTWFEYSMLATLSHAPERTISTSDLADHARGSLSRTSHATRRLEGRGLLRRDRCSEDGRVTMVVLTDAGADLLAAAAPDHVEAVRRVIFDPLSPAQSRQLAAICDVLLARGPDAEPRRAESGGAVAPARGSPASAVDAQP